MKLTIVLIGRNDISHLNRSLTAIFTQAQKHPGDVNAIYVDDCSMDGSIDFVNSISAKFPSVGFAAISTGSRANIGGARNKGVEYIHGTGNLPEYVWFHDSDDFINEGAIDRVLASIEQYNHPDCITLTTYTKRSNDVKEYPDCTVPATNIQQGVFGPIGAWAKVFKFSLYAATPSGVVCEDAAWHFVQYDRFNTWGKVDGSEPCYIWDCTNPLSVSRTEEWCGNHYMNLLQCGLDNTVVNAGKHDKWISDFLRNLANMYDIRHSLTKPWVKKAWAERFRLQVTNMMLGKYLH